MGHADSELSDGPDALHEDVDADTLQHIAAAYDNRDDMQAALEIAIDTPEERSTEEQSEIGDKAGGAELSEVSDKDLLACLWHAAREQDRDALAQAAYQRLETVCAVDPDETENYLVDVDPEKLYVCTCGEYAAAALVRVETEDHLGACREAEEKIETRDGGHEDEDWYCEGRLTDFLAEARSKDVVWIL